MFNNTAASAGNAFYSYQSISEIVNSKITNNNGGMATIYYDPNTPGVLPSLIFGSITHIDNINIYSLTTIRYNNRQYWRLWILFFCRFWPAVYRADFDVNDTIFHYVLLLWSYTSYSIEPNLQYVLSYNGKYAISNCLIGYPVCAQSQCLEAQDCACPFRPFPSNPVPPVLPTTNTTCTCASGWNGTLCTNGNVVIYALLIF